MESFVEYIIHKEVQMKFYRKKDWSDGLMIGVRASGEAFFYYQGKQLMPYTYGPYDAFTPWEEIPM